ncbi:hypothetical protein OnM2_02020 [Erysiphe neolycopersici]|uniref:Uncharacterized protein n=1 Tax=Erysiphe neolycopersici TaxID=212602 RepID=A0A420HPM2_9PEZI|nr:hypothetical protein OnM2_02020 [Erysiphe neolycopersici]
MAWHLLGVSRLILLWDKHTNLYNRSYGVFWEGLRDAGKTFMQITNQLDISQGQVGQTLAFIDCFLKSWMVKDLSFISKI